MQENIEITFTIENENKRASFESEAIKRQAQQIAGWAYFGIAMKETAERLGQ